MSNLIDARMVDALKENFFNQACQIEEAQKSRNSAGEELLTWAAVSGWESIACRKAAAGGGERRASEQTYLEATHTIVLASALEGLNTEMRVVVDGTAYDILLIEVDSEAIMTRLTCRVVL